MRFVRLLPLVAVLALAGAAHAASDATKAPVGLHGFLLRADEVRTTTFNATPSFAWKPVPTALKYQFQLSLSTTFHDNSVVYGDNTLTTPVAAPGIMLPWITGNPHSLYARVRAVTPSGDTPWSAAYGFDIVPPLPPTPLSGAPGLLRWTTVPGASAYEVWLTDSNKKEISLTNVLDERDAYTFHQDSSWTGTVHWRIRALRGDFSLINSSSPSSSGVNGIPTVQYGAWSSIYTSTNPAVTTGPLTLNGTLSDVYCPASADGSGCTQPHSLMPAFLWSGNEGLDGKAAELYRVYVFTDRQCLNRVFTSAVVGSPAYAPRPLGPLSLPTTDAAIATARTTYLSDGAEPASFMYDNGPVTPTESLTQAKPTTSPPGAPGDSAASSSSSSSGGSSSGGSASSGGVTAPKGIGAPVDLWDTDWPQSGYYWTVVPVVAVAPDALATNVASPGASAGDSSLPVTSSAGFSVGDVIKIGSGSTAETATVTGTDTNVLALSGALKNGHGTGEAVARASGSLVYHDSELPQDACWSGRVARFGKSSAPSLTASGDLFATGLSSTGRLTSALHTTHFYGQPLIAWMPALGASVYEVQWSAKKYPFTPEATSTGQMGIMTFATSLVLPVKAGNWWYRVRGFDYSLPTGAQQMTWSTPERLVVAGPTFKVAKSKKKKPTLKVVGKSKSG
jgi:hypothetical protein